MEAQGMVFWRKDRRLYVPPHLDLFQGNPQQLPLPVPGDVNIPYQQATTWKDTKEVSC